MDHRTCVFVIAVLVGQVMSMDFHAMISNLTKLSHSLNLEPDAETYTGQILTTAGEWLDLFQIVMTKGGSSILVHKKLFENIHVYEEEIKQNVLTNLNDMSEDLSIIQNTVLAFQTNVSANIVSYQKLKQKKETDIEKCEQDLQAILTEIQVIDVHIANYGPDIFSIETYVEILETKAEETKTTHILVLLLNIAVFVVGVCFRKSRGYWLVGVTTVGAVHAAVHLYDVERSTNTTRDLRATVQLIRDRVEQLRENNCTLQKRLAVHNDEIKTIKAETERLDTTITCLEQLTSIFSIVTKAIAFDLYMIQTLRDELSGIRSNRHNSQSGRLKALFEIFEKLLVSHGVQANV